MRFVIVILILVVGMLAIVVPLAAHHSFPSQFDVNKPSTMDGKVTTVQWGNPHVSVFMNVTDKTNGTVNWEIQLTSPQALIGNGWKNDTLRAGMAVCVEGFPAKDGKHVFGGASSLIVKATGQVLKIQGKILWIPPEYLGKSSCSHRDSR